ncbi:MAG: SRPBCC family protein [Bacteroidia bacterium]
MKILKYIGIALVSIVALLLIIALFIPKQYTVSVTETINKPQQEVFDYVKLVKNQEYYSVWVMSDLSSLSYAGVDGTVGCIQSWNSKNDNVGEGAQEITQISPNRIDVDLRFKRPFESNAKAATLLKAISPTVTEVTSEFYGNDTYPLNLMSFVGKKIIKDAEVQNLKNLKKVLESK